MLIGATLASCHSLSGRVERFETAMELVMFGVRCLDRLLEDLWESYHSHRVSKIQL